MSSKLRPREAMTLAIREGRRGAGFVSPNPLVGCVIVDREHRFLASGYHAKVGEAHAEINALAAVKDPKLLEGAHLYVTLEPCAHEGRTPSCAQALAKLPIASVIYGLEDPNPLVSGQGAEILRQAGKEVRVFSELQEELEELAEIFLLNQRRKRPFYALKIAASLDGRMAMANGESQWITGPASREYVQELRGEYDAVLVGVETFLKDNPRLNSRLERFQSKRQRAIVLDPNGRGLSHLENAPLLKVRPPSDVIVVTKAGVKPSLPIHHLEAPMLGDQFDLANLSQQWMSLGVCSILIEGGGRTASAFLQQRLVDRLHLFQAPKILGAGRDWTSELKLRSLANAIQVKSLRTQTLGEDIYLTGRMSWS